MAHPPDNSEHTPFAEPFGQTGVSRYLRSTFLALCCVAVGVSTMLMIRASTNYDCFYRTMNGRRFEVASAIDRFIFTISTPRPDEPESAAWNYTTFDGVGLRDGWADSWRKKLGIEWGEESFPTPLGQTYSQWRLRIRWRTLIGIYLVPLVWEAFRRRITRKRTDSDTLPAATMFSSTQ